MVKLSYAQDGLTLSPSTTPSQLVKDLQSNLRSLGYHRGPINGVFLSITTRSVSALQYDLLNNTGAGGDGSAPVAITDYNKGRVNAVSGVVNQDLVACIADMMNDPNYPKLPASDTPGADNQKALQSIADLRGSQVPFPFLYGILMQESGCKHFHVPGGSDQDNFVTVGFDTNDKANAVHITSRGYGIGQYTLFHHPPTGEELNGFIANPVGNVTMAARKLREKFDRYVIGPADQADDRIHEVGHGPLRICQFDAADPGYMSDCVNCLKQASTEHITAGVTLVYEGSSVTYEHTQYHAGSYDRVPVRKDIPCDWPYAVRRYNGSGPNSYDYQAEVLWKIVTSPPPDAAD